MRFIPLEDAGAEQPQLQFVPLEEGQQKPQEAQKQLTFEPLQDELTEWKPTTAEAIKDWFMNLIPGDRAKGEMELLARRYAAERKISVDEAYRQMKEAVGVRGPAGQRPSGQPMFNPQGTPPVGYVVRGAPYLAEAVLEAPKGLAESVLRTYRGGDIEGAVDKDYVDQLITYLGDDAKEVFIPNIPELLGMDKKDSNYESLQSAGKSFGYSLATMAASAVAGAATTAVTGSPLAGLGAGMTTAGAVAYRGSKDDFLSRVRDKLNKDSKRVFGRPMSDAEWKAAREKFDSAATEYGAWEAVPEAVTNAIFLKAFAAPAATAKGARLAAAMEKAGALALDQIGETATTYGQNAPELKAGLTKDELTVVDAFKQQFLQSLLTAGVMAGTIKAGQMAKDFYDTQVLPRVNPGSALAKAIEADIRNYAGYTPAAFRSKAATDQARSEEVGVRTQQQKLRQQLGLPTTEVPRGTTPPEEPPAAPTGEPPIPPSGAPGGGRIEPTFGEEPAAPIETRQEPVIGEELTPEQQALVAGYVAQGFTEQEAVDRILKKGKRSEIPGLVKPEETISAQEVQARQQAGEAAALGLTAEAASLLAAVDAGGVPAIMTNNMKRIAAENGIKVTGATTPNDVIEQLRQKIQGAAPALPDAVRQWDRANRSGRQTEWQVGAAESNPAFESLGSAGYNTPAHGMAKVGTLGEAYNNLVSLLSGNIDPNRPLYTAGLTAPAGVGAGTGTAGGYAYRDGPFIITFRQGLTGQPTAADITGVLVNPANAELVPVLQKQFPNLVVRSYNEAADVVNASRATAPEGQVAPAEPPMPPAAKPAVTPPQEPSGETAAVGMPVVELPLKDLTLSKDVPQFKMGADAKGVVEPLGGKFERTGVAPIQVWRRLDGSLEVISGRHRLDLARRSGEKTIPAQVHDEAQGFTPTMAAVLDAELNIRDGQGKVKDYVNYFKASGIAPQDAESRGLLARATGKRAYTIATTGSDELVAAVRNDQVGDEAAYYIALNAPNDPRLQAVGIQGVMDGKSANLAVNMMQAIKALGVENNTTTDMFGFDDSAMKEAAAMAQVANRKQREIQTRLSAISGAAKNPAVAKAEGIDIRDPEAVNRRINELRQMKAAWDNWATNPELIAEIRQDRGVQAPSLTLRGETEEEIRAREEAAAAEEQRRRAEEEAAKRAEQEAFDRKRAAETTDLFQLGQTAAQQMSGMGDLFAPPAAEQVAEEAPTYPPPLEIRDQKLKAHLDAMARLKEKLEQADSEDAFRAAVIKLAQEATDGSTVPMPKTNIAWTIKKGVNEAGTEYVYFDAGPGSAAINDMNVTRRPGKEWQVAPPGLTPYAREVIESNQPVKELPFAEGQRVRFTPNDTSPLGGGVVEGQAITIDRTNAGNYRVRLRLDEDAPQGGGKQERIVYSNAGQFEVVSGREAKPETLDLMKDGIEGREIPFTEVPNGSEAFQYALGRTEEGGKEAIYRRRANERGTYGGWRWEADKPVAKAETQRPEAKKEAKANEYFVENLGETLAFPDIIEWYRRAYRNMEQARDAYRKGEIDDEQFLEQKNEFDEIKAEVEQIEAKEYGKPKAAKPAEELGVDQEFVQKAQDHWMSVVHPALVDYGIAYRQFGEQRMENARIKEPGIGPDEWLKQLWHQQSKFEKGRKVQDTGIQYLSQKDLWPTADGSGERLRKAMLNAVKALKNAPSTNGEWIKRSINGESDIFGEGAKPAEAKEPAEIRQARREMAQGVKMTPAVLKRRRALIEWEKSQEPAPAIEPEFTADNIVNGEQPAADLPATNRLVFMPCSAKKGGKAGPAMDLYQGVFFQTFRSNVPADAMPNVVILSAEHGFIGPDTQIEPYDRLLDKARADEMLGDMPKVITDIKKAMAGIPADQIKDVLLVGGKEYQAVMRAALAQMKEDGLIPEDASVNATSGGIGEQRQQLGQYLRALPSEAREAAPAEEPATEEAQHSAQVQDEVVGTQVDKLTDEDKRTLESHYGNPVDSPALLAAVKADIIKFATKGADAVSKAIRSVIRKLHAGVLAAAMIFNPAQISTVSFTFSPPVTQTRVEQVMADVPAVVASRMSDGAKQAYSTIYPAIQERLKANDKLFIITDKPNARVFVFDPYGKPILDKKVLLGQVVGDFYKGNNALPDNRITPAGLFNMGLRDATRSAEEAKTAGEYDTKKVFVLDKAGRGEYSVTLFHSIWLKDADAMARQKAISGDDARDSRYSFGCINVDKTTYKYMVENYLPQMDGAALFIVPDDPKNIAMFLAGESQITQDELDRVAFEPKTRTVTTVTPGKIKTEGKLAREQLGMEERRRQPVKAAGMRRRKAAEPEQEKVAAEAKDQVAQFAGKRVQQLLERYGYPRSRSDTNAFVAYVNPNDFVDAATRPEDRKRVEGEIRPLYIDEMAELGHVIYLKGTWSEDFKQFIPSEHDGRHRILALRDAGVTRVPVVFVSYDRIKNAQIINSAEVTEQRWGNKYLNDIYRGQYERAVKGPRRKVVSYEQWLKDTYGFTLKDASEFNTDRGIKGFKITNAMPVSYDMADRLMLEFSGQESEFFFNVEEPKKPTGWGSVPTEREPRVNKGQEEQIREEQIRSYQAIRQRLAAIPRRVAEQRLAPGEHFTVQALRTEAQNLKAAIDASRPKRDTAVDFLAWATKQYADGEISKEVFDVIRAAFDKYPQLLEGLRFSVKQRPEGSSAIGQFFSIPRILRLYKGSTGVDAPRTIRHELTHSLEQMMTPEQRKVIVEAWRKDLEKAMQKHTDKAHKDYFDAVLEFMANPSKAAQDKVVKLLPSYDMYQFSNPSEYWAVNAEDLLGMQLGGAWQRFKRVVQRLFEGIKQVLGFDNKSDVHRVFAEIMGGEMKRLDTKMVYHEAGTRALNIEEDKKLLNKYGKENTPQTEAETTIADFLAKQYKDGKELFRDAVEDPLAAAAQMGDATLDGLVRARMATFWYGAGLESRDFARYKGQLTVGDNLAIASVALDNAIHGANIGIEVLFKGGLAYNSRLGRFVAVDRQKGMHGVYRAERALKKRIGKQLGTDIINGYLEAKRSISIMDELRFREEELAIAKDSYEYMIEQGASEEEIKESRNAMLRAKDAVTAIKRAVTSVTMSEAEMREFAALDRRHPELREILDNFKAVNQNLLKVWYDVGLLSEARYNTLSSIKDYVPWYRIMGDGEDPHTPLQTTTRNLLNIGREKRFKRGAPVQVLDFIVKEGQDTFKVPPSTVVRVEVNGTKVGSEFLSVTPEGELKIAMPEDNPLRTGDLVVINTTRQIANIIDNMTQNVMRMTINGIRHYAASRIVNEYATRTPDGHLMTFPSVDEKKGRINYILDGKKIVVEISDPLVAGSIFGLSQAPLDMWAPAAAAANLQRRGVTLSAAFQVKQVLIDAPNAAMVSGVKHPYLLILEVYKGLITSLINPVTKKYLGADIEPAINILKAAGIGGFHDPSRSPEKEIKQRLGVMNRNVYQAVMRLLDHIGDSSDMAQRVAVYKRVLAETGNETQAVFQAANVMPFLHRGSASFAQFMVKTVPFMGSSANAIDVFANALVGGNLKGMRRLKAELRLLQAGVMLGVLTLLYCMAVGGSPEYEEQDDQTKLRNIIIPGTDVMIPMYSSSAFVWKAIPEMLYNKFLNESTKNEVDLRRLKEALSRAAIDMLGGPTPVPTLAKSPAEIILNHNFVTGRELIPPNLKNVEAFEQFDARTSELAKWLSKYTEFGSDGKRLLSPIEAEHLVRGLLGLVGATAGWLSNRIAVGEGQRPESTKRETPIIGSFMQPEVGRRNEDLFYDLKEEVDKKYKTWSLMMDRGEDKEAGKYETKNEKLLDLYQDLNKINDALGEINSEIRELETSKTLKMTAEKRRDQINKLRREKMELLYDVIEMRKEAGFNEWRKELGFDE